MNAQSLSRHGRSRYSKWAAGLVGVGSGLPMARCRVFEERGM
jgi:hypothetical protein